MKIELIGYVGVDSGQLMICDPCYIDSQWEKEDFEDIRIYKHKKSGDTLQYRVDFEKYDQVIPKYGKTMNELGTTGEWEQQDVHEVKHNFSYNACTQATLSEDGHGQLNYNLGHPGVGVAFSTAFGDGKYPVYAHYDDEGIVFKVEVEFFNPEED